MEVSCDVVRDLLPRYCAGACSAGSRALVEEHLIGCEACRNKLVALRSELSAAPGAEPAKTEVGKKRGARFWKSALIAVLILAALAAAIRTSFALVTMSGNGMTPVAADGDKCLFWKSAYWLHGPKDGDVVFTNLEIGGRQIHTVLRVIGAPGETVEVMDGVLYRGGVAVPVDGVESYPSNTNLKATPVPKGCCLVAADNLFDPADSSFDWGFHILPLDEIGGRLLWVLP
jgi:signal peptidase I